jgi:hypothetical protein
VHPIEPDMPIIPDADRETAAAVARTIKMIVGFDEASLDSLSTVFAGLGREAETESLGLTHEELNRFMLIRNQLEAWSAAAC